MNELQVYNFFVNNSTRSIPGNNTWVQCYVNFTKNMLVKPTADWNELAFKSMLAGDSGYVWIDDIVLVASNISTSSTSGPEQVVITKSGKSNNGLIAGVAGGGGGAAVILAFTAAILSAPRVGAVLVFLIIVIILFFYMRKKNGLGMFGFGNGNWNVDFEDLEFVKRIGKRTYLFPRVFTPFAYRVVSGVGSFGEVYLGNYRGTQVAIKKLFNQALDAKALKEFAHETSFMWYVLVVQALRFPLNRCVSVATCATRTSHCSWVPAQLPPTCAW